MMRMLVRNRFYVMGILLIGLIVGILSAFSTSVDEYTLVFTATILNILFCFLIFVKLYLKKIEIIEPIVPVSITWLFFFGLRPLYVLIYNDYEFLTTKGANISMTVGAQWMAAISFLFFIIGYFLFRKRGANNTNSPIKVDFDVKAFKIYLLILAILSLPLFIIYIKNQGALGYGNIDNETFVSKNAYFYKSDLMLFTISFLILALYWFKKVNLIITLCINIPVIWIIITGGSRIPIIIYGLASFTIWYVKRRLFNQKIPINKLVLLGILGILLMNWIGRIRSSMTSLGFVKELDYSFEESASMLFSSQGDLNIFDTWSIVYYNSDLLPKNYGFVFIQLLLHPIPRAIWSNKPEVPSNAYMRILMPYYYEKGIGFSSSILGDFLLMYGKIGIIPLMFLSGLLCGLIFKKVSSSQKLFSWLLYAPFYGWLPIILRGEIITTTVLIAAYVIPILLFRFFSKRNDYVLHQNVCVKKHIMDA